MTETIERSILFNTKDATVVDERVGESDESETLIRVPISSTSVDRDGDEFSERGLANLRDQITDTNVPVFGNHGRDGDGMFGLRYDWKSMLGTQVQAEIENDVLFSYIRPNKSHPDGEGELLLSMVEEGQAVGFSVGFRATKYEERENSEDNYVFHDADLMESSAVGIQSNPDAVASAMAKGVDDLNGVDIDEAELARHLVDGFKDAGDTPALATKSERATDTTMTENDVASVLEKLGDLNDEVTRLHDRFDKFADAEMATAADDAEATDAEKDTDVQDEAPEPVDAERMTELEAKVAELTDALDEKDVDESETNDAVTDADETAKTATEGFL